MSGFTKGPWSVPHFADADVKCNCANVLSESYMGAIATIHIDNGLPVSAGGNDCPPLDEATANGRLIAAAPDMYEALEKVLGHLGSGIDGKGVDYAEMMGCVQDALARVRGEG